MVRILIFIALIFILYFDIRKLYIPNSLNFSLLILAFIYKERDFLTIESGVLGMAIYSLPLVFLYGYLSDILDREVFGFGDIKLLFPFGYILGYTNLFDIYLFYLISFITASIIGGIYVLKNRRGKTLIPFSPFLILSFLYVWLIR